MASVGFNCERCGTLVHLTSYHSKPIVPKKLCFRCLKEEQKGEEQQENEHKDKPLLSR